jgi:hypothetical protein
MEMSKPQRDDLATRVAEVRLSRYRGNRKAAYTDAGVNSATWARVESGLSVAERSCVAIVATLWPESGGDWRRLDPPLGINADVVAEVQGSNMSQAAKEIVLRTLAEEQSRADDGNNNSERGTA